MSTTWSSLSSDLIDRLQKGDGWATKREGGGFGGASTAGEGAHGSHREGHVPTVKEFLKAKVDAGATYPKLSAAFEEDDTVGPVIKRLKKEKAAGHRRRYQGAARRHGDVHFGSARAGLTARSV
jgi:hypothetical protein